MLFCFGILVPIGIFFARYYNHMPSWVEVHKLTMLLSATALLVASLTGIVENHGQHLKNPHSIIGILMTVLLATMVVSGYVSEGITFSSKLLRYYHKWMGITLFLLSYAQIFLGTQRLVLITPWLPSYAPFISLIVTPLTCILLALKYFSTKFDLLMNEVSMVLPMYTWEEFHKKISEGQQWIIVDEKIYDISSFKKRHPGGKNVLISSIGMDVSESFSRSAAGRGTVIAKHVHSRAAMNQLSKLVIGRTEKSTPALFTKMKSVTSLTNLEAPFAEVQQEKVQVSKRTSVHDPGWRISMVDAAALDIPAVSKVGRRSVTGEPANKPLAIMNEYASARRERRGSVDMQPSTAPRSFAVGKFYSCKLLECETVVTGSSTASFRSIMRLEIQLPQPAYYNGPGCHILVFCIYV